MKPSGDGSYRIPLASPFSFLSFSLPTGPDLPSGTDTDRFVTIQTMSHLRLCSMSDSLDLDDVSPCIAPCDLFEINSSQIKDTRRFRCIA